MVIDIVTVAIIIFFGLLGILILLFTAYYFLEPIYSNWKLEQDEKKESLRRKQARLAEKEARVERKKRAEEEERRLREGEELRKRKEEERRWRIEEERRWKRQETEKIRIYNLPINVERRRLADVERRRKEEAEQKRRNEKKLKCSYCNSGTNYVCRVPNGCKNGVCKRCRESGRAKEHFKSVVIKKRWHGQWADVRSVRDGYKCKKCATSKWFDDGSDVGY